MAIIDRKTLLDAALAGYDTPVAAALFLFPPPEGYIIDPAIVDEIAKVLVSTDFNTEFQRAKDDIIGMAVASFKRDVMQNVLEMKEIAKTATDPRVRYTANKDILDRVGLAPTQKTMAYSPADYLRLVEGLQSKSPEGLQTKDKSNDTSNTASAESTETKDQPGGVVQEDRIPTPEGPSGS